MEDNLQGKVYKLLNAVSAIEEISAIGQTGDPNILPKSGESDLDIFLLGDKIPSYDKRKAIYEKNRALWEQCTMNVCEGGNWGTGDILIIDGVETMLMYFDTTDTLKYVDDILEGRHLDSVKGFYPVGRCATLKNIYVIYDERGILASLKEKLLTYPEGLKQQMVGFHLRRTHNEEDFGRALLRKEALFYHQVLEAAMDHYLQALFAVNETFFPSRKRTKQYLDAFKLKPENCYERLLEVIKLGSSPDSVEKSYHEWCELVKDLKYICNAK